MRKHYNWTVGKAPPELDAHSKAKHEILYAYVRRYIEICTSTPVQERFKLTIVDGFSGGGRYRYQGGEVPGSPLILLTAVAEMQDVLSRTRAKGFDLAVEFIFLDSRKANRDFLRAEIEASPFAGELDRSIQIWSGTFDDRVVELVELARRRSPLRGRSLFLLDQYGWSSVAFSSVRRILNNLPKAEVFLTFAVDALVDYLSDAGKSRETFGKVGFDAGMISDLLRIKDEENGWRTIIQNTLYSRLMEETGAEFYSPFFIRSAKAHRSYWFVHLSRHREARNEIGNIHWRHSDHSLHHGGAGLNALGFAGRKDVDQMVFGYEFDEGARQHSRRALAAQIPHLVDAFGGQDASPTLEELFGRRCNDTPVTRELFESVLLGLRDHRELRIEDAFGVDKPRAQNVRWSDRIVISRQRSFFGPFGTLA